jgi:hypothetical protein
MPPRLEESAATGAPKHLRDTASPGQPNRWLGLFIADQYCNRLSSSGSLAMLMTMRRVSSRVRKQKAANYYVTAITCVARGAGYG